LVNKYSKHYGIEHLAIAGLSKLKMKVTEKKVVASILLSEVFIAVLVIIIYT